MNELINKALQVLAVAEKCNKPYTPVILVSSNGITIRGKEFEILIAHNLTAPTGVTNRRNLESIAFKRKVTEEDLLNVCVPTNETIFDFVPLNDIVEVNAKSFKRDLEVIKKATDKKGARPILTGMLINSDKLVSVDGYRVHTRSITDLGFKAVLPSCGIELLSKLITKSSQLCIGYHNKSILIGLDDLCIKIDELEGDFLDYKRVFSDTSEYKITANTKQLVRALNEIIKVPYYDYSDLVGKKITNKTMICRNRPLKIGFSDSLIDEIDMILSVDGADPISIPVKHDLGTKIKSFSIYCNPWYLLEALKVSYDDETIVISFISQLTPIILSSINSKCLVLPIRVNK